MCIVPNFSIYLNIFFGISPILATDNPPDPERVIEGLRDTGYDFNTAIADIVDNSIAADASRIDILINMDPQGEETVYIADNGTGMNLPGLRNAMKYDSDRRPDPSSLGKFGLGLKTASTSFCRKLSLISRGPDDEVRKVQWDFDYVAIMGWKLKQMEVSDDEEEIFEQTAGNGTGTLVVWENNYWWVTRPKRKLNSIPEVLSWLASVSLYSEWQGNIYTHLAFEEALETCGLKRIGERRDRRGGGGRTYYAWLASLGLVFTHEATGQTMLTSAGEAIVDGKNPVEVLRNQVLKYQFPSPFSLSPASSKSQVDSRFKIRPFRFLLKLLREKRLEYRLSQEEIARVIAVEACDEKDSTYEYVVQRILQYRESGVTSLPSDFLSLYAPSSGRVNPEHPFSHLDDLAT